MSHKCFISFKKEDMKYKDEIVAHLKAEDIVGRALDRWINSDDPDYIMRAIRKDYLCDSSVTLYLIGEHSAENEGKDEEQRDKNFFIQRELQASLYDGEGGNTINGIVGVVLPAVYPRIFQSDYVCKVCGKQHFCRTIDDSTVVREFSANYFIKPKPGCCWNEDDRYCVLVKYDDFMEDPDRYIDLAFDKRDKPVRNRISVRNLR